jgi:hypothetical protein
VAAPRTCGGEAGAGTFDDQLAFELGQPGEDREDQPAIARRLIASFPSS